MNILQILLFLIAVGVTFYFAYKKFSEVRHNIMRGQKVDFDPKDSGQRWKNMLLIGLGQKKMFKKPVPAIFHSFIYIAFLLTQIELLEIFIDGFLGKHRAIYGLVEGTFLGGFYTLIINFIEIFSVLAFIATVVFLARRNLFKVPRFIKPEMKGWPKLDGNIILYLEIALLVGVFCMNVGDKALQMKGVYHETGPFLVSGAFAHLFKGLPTAALIGMERFGWWMHILTVFGFLNYLPYSKHLHVMLAFPNTYFSDLKPKGEMENMPEITKEIQLMMDPNAPMEEPPADEEPQKFGAKDIEDFTWPTLLSAYTCTECGRCTDACPANQTGKVLSPRAIVMALRDRMEDKTKNEKEHGADYKDEKSLFDYITKEEINACTTCNACVEECPVNISPMSMILELRRYKIMEEADSVEEWNLMFTNTENNGAVWQFNPADRAKWTKEVEG